MDGNLLWIIDCIPDCAYILSPISLFPSDICGIIRVKILVGPFKFWRGLLSNDLRTVCRWCSHMTVKAISQWTGLHTTGTCVAGTHTCSLWPHDSHLQVWGGSGRVCSHAPPLSCWLPGYRPLHTPGAASCGVFLKAVTGHSVLLSGERGLQWEGSVMFLTPKLEVQLCV